MRDLRALVVEDDQDIASLLVETLRGSGFEVRTAADGREALEVASHFQPDLVSLDLTLPRIDGIEVCRRMRESSDCYIVIVSARADEIDRLIGLEVGADDYVLKPFSPRELRARVAALFRRPRGTAVPPTPALGAVDSPPDVVDCGAGLCVDAARREVTVHGEVVDLTRIEHDVLAHLARHLSRVCPRGEIVREVWSSDLAHDTHLVDVHVANLRGKLRRHSDATWIHTIRGIGYRLDQAPGDSGWATDLD